MLHNCANKKLMLQNLSVLQDKKMNYELYIRCLYKCFEFLLLYRNFKHCILMCNENNYMY
jgi:hypothetical protein